MLRVSNKIDDDEKEIRESGIQIKCANKAVRSFSMRLIVESV